MPDIKTILAQIGVIAIAFVVGFLVGKKLTDDGWRQSLALADHNAVITTHKDTTQPKPILIAKPLNPQREPDTVRVPIKLTTTDSLCLFWGMRFLNFWANLGYEPEEAFTMQDSLTIKRGFEIQDDLIGYLKVSYAPLRSFNLNIEEIRPAIISTDTTRTTPAIIQPKSFIDYLVQYGGYVLAFVLLLAGIR